MVKWLKCFRWFRVWKGARTFRKRFRSLLKYLWSFRVRKGMGNSEPLEPLCGSRLNTVNPVPKPSGSPLAWFDRPTALLLTLRADEATDTASDNDPPLVSTAGATACFTSSTSIADTWDASLITALPIHSASVHSASVTTTANWSSMLVSMLSLSASRQCLSQASYPNLASAAAIIE